MQGEILRKLVVGKEVNFKISYSTSGNLEFGELFLNSPNGPVDVAEQLLKSGWAKLKEARKNDDGEDERRLKLKQDEDEAREAGLGLWGQKGEVCFLSFSDNSYSLQTINQNLTPPSDPQAFLTSHKGQDIDAIVEQVSNGSTVRCRLLLTPTEHQFITIQMAGIRCPRAGSTNASESGQPAEEFGNEARFFAEARLLQRNVKVTLHALPPNATSTSAYIGTVTHPAGNIAALLLSNGFAKCVDLHAGILGAEKMGVLRKAESEAKSAKRNLWQNVITNGAANGRAGKEYEGV